ncbi:MAG: hypothetical protein AAFP68_22760, partial [Pseudomonadota bacterium]
YAVLSTLYERQLLEKPTRIRQLHQLAGIGQPSALKVVRQLENEGVLRVTSVLHDEFESRIELTKKAQRKLASLVPRAGIPSIPG